MYMCDLYMHTLPIVLVYSYSDCLSNAFKIIYFLQVEVAKRCHFRAKDHFSLSRLREAEGDFSGAIRVFVQANKRLEALEKSKIFEMQGLRIEPDVASLQLANTYAKYYLSRQDEATLMKVLQYIPNVVLRVAHLKKGKLYDRAIDEYVKAGYFKDAERLIVSQELYDRGMELAVSRDDKTMEARFILMKTTALIHNNESIDESLDAKLLALTKSSSIAVQAKALLLYGMVQNKSSYCREASKIYTESCISTIGALEAFNQHVSMRKRDIPYSSVIVKCYEARELIQLFHLTKATPTRSKAIQQMLEFYKINKCETCYLLLRSQDVWVKRMSKIAKETDENGMLVLEPAKVYSCLVDHYSDYVSYWLTETETEKQIVSRLASFSFHQRVSEQGYLTSYLNGYPPNIIKDYIQVVDSAIKVQSFNPNRLFRGLFPETLPLKLFSFRVSLCVPLSKINCFQFRRSEATHNVLVKTMDSLITVKALRQPDVDELFKAWFCQCLMDSETPNHFEETIETFARKEGAVTANHAKPWLIVDRHGKAIMYHHLFAFWLKACRLIREGNQVLVASKLVYNCFFTVIARRPQLRKTVSVINYIFPITVFASALVGVLSVAKPGLGLCLPLFYRYQCQLFDVLNIQGGQQFWLLSACVKLAEDKKSDARVVDDTIDLLYKMLQLLLGVYQTQFDLLRIALSPESNACEDGSLLHCLVCIIVLLAVVEIIMPHKQEELYRLLVHVQELLRVSLDDPETKTPKYVKNVLEMLETATTVADLFSITQFILHSSGFPSHLGKMQAAKTGNMDFKEISSIPQQAGGLLLRPKVLTPTPPPPPLPQPSPPSPPPVHEESEPPSQSSELNTTATNTATATVHDQPVTTGRGGEVGGVVEPAPVSVDPQLHQQWIFTMQRLEELRQYGTIIEQQLTQLRQVPPHLLTPAHEQQQYFLTQQYYQIMGAQQQYKLQQDSIQQQYQLSLLSSQQAGGGGQGQPTSSLVVSMATTQEQPFPSIGVTMATSAHVFPSASTNVSMATPQMQPDLLGVNVTSYPGSSPQMGHVTQDREQDDETDIIFDEEEIENILGSLMSGGDPPQGGNVPHGIHPIDEDFTLSPGMDTELVDNQYCQVCGVSFVKQSVMDDLELEGGGVKGGNGSEYKEHIRNQFHIENLQAYKKFNAIKSGPYSLLRSKLEEALVRGRELIAAAEVDALVLQVTSELGELDEQLEESTNSYNWKEAHSRLVSSLDLLQSLALRLTRTCETVAYVNERLPRREGCGQDPTMMMGTRREEERGGGGSGYVDDIDEFELTHEKFIKTRQRKARI